jgi:hypothetical protein
VIETQSDYISQSPDAVNDRQARQPASKCSMKPFSRRAPHSASVSLTGPNLWFLQFIIRYLRSSAVRYRQFKQTWRWTQVMSVHDSAADMMCAVRSLWNVGILGANRGDTKCPADAVINFRVETARRNSTILAKNS